MRPVAEALGSFGGLLGSSTTAPASAAEGSTMPGFIMNWLGSCRMAMPEVGSLRARRPLLVTYSLGTLSSIRRLMVALGTPWALALVLAIASMTSSCTQRPSWADQTSTMLGSVSPYWLGVGMPG